MKKFIILLGTMSAFLFACLFFVPSVYADELPEGNEPNTEEVTPVVEETEQEEVTPAISEDDAKKYAEMIGAVTNDKVAEMSMTLYYAIGGLGILLVAFAVVIFVLAKGKAKNDAIVQALLSKLKVDLEKMLQDAVNEKMDAYIKNGTLTAEELRKFMVDVINLVKDKKIIESDKAFEEANAYLDSILANNKKID